MSRAEQAEADVLAGYLAGFEGKVVRHLHWKSPAYKHGYNNGVADRQSKVHERAGVSRARWAMICSATK